MTGNAFRSDAPRLQALRGRVALISGGSKGIGLAIARTLLEHGASVAIAARGEAGLSKAREELIELAGDSARVLTTVADVTQPDSVVQWVATATQQFGGIDILINNAVSSVQNTFDGLSDDDWQWHINVKLLGYVRLARESLPALRRSGRGRIINIGGMSARHVTAYRITNGAVNSAISNFSKHLAQQVGADGVTVNTVHPGYTQTERLDAGLEQTARLQGKTRAVVERERLQEIPIGRFVQPNDIAQLTAFLVSDAASGITGQAIAVDGGSGLSIPY